jgi:hypothetical protein
MGYVNKNVFSCATGGITIEMESILSEAEDMSTVSSLFKGQE